MKRVILTLVLMFFIFSSSTVVYAYYEDTQDVYLNEVSDTYIVDERLVSDEGSTLVPSSAIRTVTDVYEITYEYDLVVKKGLALDVDIDDLFFTNTSISEDNLREVFNFDITTEYGNELRQSEHLFGEKEEAIEVTVTVTVSMNEPTTYDLYQSLVGGQLTFDVFFYIA